jgi:hypothetical protein
MRRVEAQEATKWFAPPDAALRIFSSQRGIARFANILRDHCRSDGIETPMLIFLSPQRVSRIVIQMVDLSGPLASRNLSGVARPEPWRV